MNKQVLFGMLLALIVMSVSVKAAPVDITTCTALNTAGNYYRMTSNVTYQGTQSPCFLVTAHNIVLDMNGFSINTTDISPSTEANTGVIRLQSVNNFTVKDGYIRYMPNATATPFSREAVYFSWSNNSVIRNVSIENSTGNSVTISFGYGGQNNTIDNCQLRNNYTGGSPIAGQIVVYIQANGVERGYNNGTIINRSTLWCAVDDSNCVAVKLYTSYGTGNLRFINNNVNASVYFNLVIGEEMNTNVTLNGTFFGNYWTHLASNGFSDTCTNQTSGGIRTCTSQYTPNHFIDYKPKNSTDFYNEPSITMNDMQFITPTFANNTNTTNATVYINVSTNSSITDVCLLEIANATGAVNLTMNKQTGVIGDKDACNLAFAQSSSYLVKFKVFANNTIGQSNQSDVLSITVDNVLPNITDTTISADCFAVGDGATISWNQQDDIYIMNSTCYWTSPVTSTAYTTTMLPGDGPRSCYQVLNEYGVWQWHLYLNDSAGNTHDYYSGVNARAAGTCGGSSPPGGGGGGGGGGGWQPTPINVSEIPVITAKQIEALPATRWFQGLIAPRLGPFSVFHALVFAGALFYFRKPKNREGRNVIFALAIIAFAFLIVWQSVNMSISDVMMSIQSLIGNVNIPNIPIIQQGGTP